MRQKNIRVEDILTGAHTDWSLTQTTSFLYLTSKKGTVGLQNQFQPLLQRVMIVSTSNCGASFGL